MMARSAAGRRQRRTTTATEEIDILLWGSPGRELTELRASPPGYAAVIVPEAKNRWERRRHAGPGLLAFRGAVTYPARASPSDLPGQVRGQFGLAFEESLDRPGQPLARRAAPGGGVVLELDGGFHPLTAGWEPGHDPGVPLPTHDPHREPDLNSLLPPLPVDLLEVVRLLEETFGASSQEAKGDLLRRIVGPALLRLVDLARGSAEGGDAATAAAGGEVLAEVCTRVLKPSQGLLTVHQAAEELGLSDRIVMRYGKQGRLGHLNYDVYRIARACLDEFRRRERPVGRPKKG
jgi:hypothetical protein